MRFVTRLWVHDQVIADRPLASRYFNIGVLSASKWKCALLRRMPCVSAPFPVAWQIGPDFAIAKGFLLFVIRRSASEPCCGTTNDEQKMPRYDMHIPPEFTGQWVFSSRRPAIVQVPSGECHKGYKFSNTSCDPKWIKHVLQHAVDGRVRQYGDLVYTVIHCKLRLVFFSVLKNSYSAIKCSDFHISHHYHPRSSFSASSY